MSDTHPVFVPTPEQAKSDHLDELCEQSDYLLAGLTHSWTILHGLRTRVIRSAPLLIDQRESRLLAGMGIVLILSVSYLDALRSRRQHDASWRFGTALISASLVVNLIQTIVDLVRGWQVSADLPYHHESFRDARLTNRCSEPTSSTSQPS